VLLIACLHGGEHRPAKDLGLRLLRVQALQVPGVRQYLRNHRPPRLGIPGSFTSKITRRPVDFTASKSAKPAPSRTSRFSTVSHGNPA
jgi:hypothetical protein